MSVTNVSQLKRTDTGNARSVLQSVVMLLLPILFSAVFTACSTSSEDNDDVEQQLDEVRMATADYHDMDKAVEEGWLQASPCVYNPDAGGMGLHFVKGSWTDGRKIITQPQALLYEPLEGGGYEFVGVEYIIPYEYVSADSEPPVLFGQQYHPDAGKQQWALHVWSEKENPSGIFADWNPNVSCDFEIEAQLADLRSATADYDVIDNAIADGWDTDISNGCVESDAGGMGHHYANQEYLNDGRRIITEPQVLLYEPLEGGGYEFVGVEYIISYQLHGSDQDPPVIFGQEYKPDSDKGQWALHVWSEKDNPDGMYEDFNPEISCEFEQASMAEAGSYE
ncbi:MAG: hypothetical protein WD266_12310 [Balneolales bacterium]